MSFNKGDIVYLKSGSPAMTITAGRGSNAGDYFIAAWLSEDGKINSYEFHVEQLTPEPTPYMGQPPFLIILF